MVKHYSSGLYILTLRWCIGGIVKEKCLNFLRALRSLTGRMANESNDSFQDSLKITTLAGK
jgi:hypothetical protein